MITLILHWLIGHMWSGRSLRSTAGHTVHRVRHFFAAFFVALEGHLLLVFVYPHFYPILHTVSELTGFGLGGFYYGSH